MESRFSSHDNWPSEREGYSDSLPVAYPAVPLEASPKSGQWIRWEERLASLLAGGGLIWAAKVFTAPVARIDNLLATPGPLEVCAVGILIWLHAKWRRALLR